MNCRILQSSLLESNNELLISLFAFNANAVQQWMRGKQSHDGDNEKEQGSQEKNSQFGGRRRSR